MSFGISSAPEQYQKRMNNDFSDVIYLIDDILVHGTCKAEHDRYLEAALRCIQSAGITLNKDKCEF